MPCLLKPLIAALIASAGLVALPARADLHYGFDAGAEGWTVVDGGALTWQAAGGNGGGFLQFTDLNSQDMRGVIALGGVDWSAYLGGTLSFDAKNLSGHTNFWGPFGEVMITSTAGQPVTVDAAAAGEPANDGAWHTYTVKLTPATFGGVLGSVQSLSIKTEFAVSDPNQPSTFETMGLDNVRLTAAVPEPAAWMLWMAGGLLLTMAGRRR